MICPYCNNEMEHGLVLGDGRRTLTWKVENESESKMAKLAGHFFSTNEDVISQGGFASRSYVEGDRCPQCRKIILSY